MTTFIVRRLLISIPVFLGITMIVFTFVALAPGDAATAMMRPDLGNNPAIREAIIKQFGLDQPIPIRYVRWLAGVLQGDFGYRLIGGQPIIGEIARGLSASMILMGTALVVGILVGVPLGVLSAVRQYSKLDFMLTGITFMGISMPSFLLGIGGLWLIGLQLNLVPIAGMLSVGKPFEPGRPRDPPRVTGDDPRLRLRGDLHALHEGIDARGRQLGLHDHRPVQGPRQRHGHPAPRLPQRASSRSSRSSASRSPR